LYAALGNDETLAWLAPHAFVARAGFRLAQYWVDTHRICNFRCTADGKGTIVFAFFPEHLVELCDVLFRLLAASVVHSLVLDEVSPSHSVPINAPTLSYLIEQYSSLKNLTLRNLKMDEDHCRVLGSHSWPDLEIELKGCAVSSSGASALAEALGRNRGPTRLDHCDIDNFVLADGLRGNSRLRSFRQTFSEVHDVGNRQVLTIANAVRENKGLVELNLFYGSIVNDETWGAVCDSVKTHPKLEELDLLAIYRLRRGHPSVAPDVIRSRMQTLLDMMRVNTSIRRIGLDSHYTEHDIYRESVIPYLVMNRLRPRLLAIQKTRSIAYRAKVLGRALLAVRTDANSFWMLLSGNAEVAFPSRTATTTLVANLATTAIAGATSSANAAPAAAAAAAAAASTGATAATAINVDIAAPAAGQKRKASP
jgi:hypothetical protein